MSFSERLGKELLFFDGAMGTILQKNGLSAGELPEIRNIENPYEIFEIHRSYIDSGADIIKTNTFGANRFKLADSGYKLGDVIGAGISAAKRAAAGAGRECYAALDIGPTGKLMKPCGELGFEEAYEAFAEVVKCGEGADLILIETMTDIYEVKAALLAAKENSTLPVVVTMAFDEYGKLLTGADVEAAVCLVESLGADAVGFNCGLGPEQMKKLIGQLTAAASIPIVINPNAGLPVSINGKTVFNVGADEFAASMKELVNAGASMVGGCCGTTPEHIKKCVEACKGMPIKKCEEKNFTVVSSYTKAVNITKCPVVIGERINPTGKKRLKQALTEGDMEYIYREAITQTEKGAHILDVNVGLPGIDEPQMMKRAVEGIQSITDAPLQIDTSNIQAMEGALRIYNGKPLINSVNGKKESMDAVFPLVKKYGACVVALTLDENGIPETAQGRIKIAENIIRAAEEYGIPKKNIIIDPLAMTISTNQKNAQIVFDVLRYAGEILGVKTVLGVSNISFGLPQRERINSAFYSMALSSGLSAGIINPSSEVMMSAYRSYCALCGYDNACEKYIECYTGDASVQSKPDAPAEMTLRDAVIKGLNEQANSCTRAMLADTQAIDIIENELIPALNVVGKRFEEKTLFLPQLLKSADAAKSAFDAIKDYLSAAGQVQEKKGKIVLATVYGDIHDIGKNIVKVLLENYCFEVIDLGKNVPPEVIVETALRENVRLVGLSALMTTTVDNMEETIKQLRAVWNGKIMVGGAVLTEEYAAKIGADFYSKDAMGSVRYAGEVLAE